MDIIATALTDQQKPIPNIRTRNFFIVDGCLDEQALKNALDSLVRDHWRKLGARLVNRPSDGLLEYHLPREFAEGYALFSWTSQEYDQSIEKIPSFPKATPPENGLALLPHLSSVESWFRPTDWPLDRKSEHSDAPLLYVHMSLFSDATVIGMSCPHSMSDQFGVSNIIKAWLGLIKGETPPLMLGGDKDILDIGKPYKEYPVAEVIRKGRTRVRRRMEYTLGILGLVPELIMNREEVAYTLFFPRPMVQALREKYIKLLTDKYGSDPGVTNGDVVSSALLKLSRMHRKSSPMISFTQSVNTRGRIPQLEKGHDGFIHNSLQFSTCRFRFYPTLPLSEIVYLNRKAIIQAIDPKDIEITMEVTREMVRRGQPVHACEPLEQSFSVISWSGAWRELDFSPAVKQGEGQAPLPKLQVLGESKVLGRPDRFSPTIMCSTDEGYWCSFSVPPKTIKLVKEYLNADPLLERM